MVGLIASRELKETLRDGRVLMMWVVPVIACAVLQWMLLQTPVFSQPLSEQGDTLHLAYDGPEWLRAVIENDATRLTHDADVTSVDGYLTAAGTGSALRIDVNLLSHTDKLQRAMLEQHLHTVHVEMGDVIGAWYSIDRLPPWTIRSHNSTQTMDLSAGLKAFATTLGPLIWLPLIALHFNNMVMPAVDMTDESTRGTDETTQMLPCSPAVLLAGKTLAVCVLGVIATGGQCAAMLLAIGHSMMLLLQSIPAALFASTALEVVWPTPPSIGQVVLVTAYWVPTTLAHAALLTWGAQQATTRTAKEVVTLCVAGGVVCASLLATSLAPTVALWIPLINAPAALSHGFTAHQLPVGLVAAGTINLLVAYAVLAGFRSASSRGPLA